MNATNVLKLIDAAREQGHAAGYDAGCTASTASFQRTIEDADKICQVAEERTMAAQSELAVQQAAYADVATGGLALLARAERAEKRADEHADACDRLAAVTAERDSLATQERQIRLALGIHADEDVVVRICNGRREAQDQIDALAAEVARLSATDRECGLPCFRLQQEQFRASSLESDVARLTAELTEARQERAHAEARRQETAAENARLQDENTAYCYASAFSVQHLADARLGRMVRRMNGCLKITEGFKFGPQSRWCYSADDVNHYRGTPEEALQAAGVTDPRPEIDYCDTDDVAAALRAEDAERDRLVALGRDRDRLDWLNAQKHIAVRIEPGVVVLILSGGRIREGENWRQAIDAARGEAE